MLIFPSGEENKAWERDTSRFLPALTVFVSQRGAQMNLKNLAVSRSVLSGRSHVFTVSVSHLSLYGSR